MDNQQKNELHRAYIIDDMELMTKAVSNIPQSVIKFFSGIYSGDSNRYLDLLTNRQLWVTAPQFFNDPFDCAININYKSSSYQLLLNKLYAYFDKEESVEKLLEMAKKDKAGFEGLLDFITYDYKNSAQKFIDQVFVSCFSELSNLKSLRMWGYYANSHRGFCLEYNTYEIFSHLSNEPFSKDYVLFLPVIYSDNYILHEKGERSDYGRRKFISSYAYVKASEWEYENEWRLVIFNNIEKKQKGYIIPFIAPVRIYLGCKIEDKLKIDLLNICKQMGICAYQAYMKPNSYNLAYKIIDQ